MVRHFRPRLTTPLRKARPDSPHDEAQLVSDALSTGKGVLEIVYCPSALFLWQLADKGVKVLLLGRFEDDDRSLVLRQAVDDVRELLARLELEELVETVGGLWERGWPGSRQGKRAVSTC